MRDRTAPVLLAATILWTLALAAFGANEAILFCAPALLIALPLAFGRYLGEGRLEAVRERLSRAARRRRPAPARLPRTSDVRLLPRGGRLLAASLAKRPPPLAAALT